MSNSLLIDVRTPGEFATGSLDGAINIEYQNIRQLALTPGVRKNDDVALYCRSGRRSNIALQALKSIGFERARDIGSLEAARETLRQESTLKSEAPESDSPEPSGVSATKETLEKSTKTLLDGLKALG